MHRLLTLACSLIAVSLLASGCGQGDGEPCQEADDCNSGLLCCPVTRAAVERGTCSAVCVDMGRDAGPGGTDAGPRDASMSLDAAADASTDVDASVDAGPMSIDAGGSDSGAGDAGTDAGTDSGPPAVDAATPVDAGFDAG